MSKLHFKKLIKQNPIYLRLNSQEKLEQPQKVQKMQLMNIGSYEGI